MPSPGPRTVLMLFALLIGATWTVGLTLPKHLPVSPALGVALHGESARWTALRQDGSGEFAVTDESVALGDAPGERGAGELRVTVPLARPARDEVRVRLSATVAEPLWTEPVTGSSALVIRTRGADGELVSHNLVHVAPSRYRLTAIEKVIGWPSEAASVEVALYRRAGGPAIALREARIDIVQRSLAHRVARRLLLCSALAWGALAAWFVLARLVRAHRAGGSTAGRWPLLPLAAVGVLALVTAGTTLSAEAMRPVLHWAGTTARQLFGIDAHVALLVLLKGGHLLGFLMLTVALIAARRALGIGVGLAVAFALLVAIGTEGLQTNLSGRSGSLRDFLINSAGILLAVGWLRWRERRPAA